LLRLARIGRHKSIRRNTGDMRQFHRPQYALRQRDLGHRCSVSACVGTFPLPVRLTPDRPTREYADDPHAIAIAEGARRLNELREAWPKPPDLVERLPEVVPGFPDRIAPVSPKAAAILKNVP
jgi:hypothetical protein